MLVTYALYVLGVLEPQVPLTELPRLWTGSAADYRAAGHIPQGWGWLALVGKGDICNFLGIVFLAALTIICFLQLAWSLIRRKQWLMTSIALLEVLVLSLAASRVSSPAAMVKRSFCPRGAKRRFTGHGRKESTPSAFSARQNPSF